MAENPSHYCVVAMPEEQLGKTKAALLSEFKWQPGAIVKVRFLEGAPSLRKRVEAVAKRWAGAKMANLELTFVDKGDADIRVAFRQGNGSWSYLGTMCHRIPKEQPTMNYGWLTETSPDDEVERVVLHEFGHALGLIHEHQNPEKPIQWNRAAVTRDLSGPPNNWDAQTIENNIFKRYDPTQITGTPVDAQSIMMYPIPAAWTVDGFSADLNSTLSAHDTQFIRGAYPW